MTRNTKVYPTQISETKNQNNHIHVALVYGGMSSEREVTLMSAQNLKKALLDLGYKVTPLDMGHDVAVSLYNLKPDVVFNGLYGTHGEDGCLPGTLEILGIKYTHSGVLASATGFNKEASYKAFQDIGLQCPNHKIIQKADNIKNDPMPRPYVIKPLSEGSSVGIILVFKEDDFRFTDYEWKHGDRIIVEEYIPGKEIHTAVFADKALGSLEIVPLKNRFYDYETKYTEGMAKHIVPAPIDKEDYEHILSIAEQAHNAIGAKTLSRVDFRYNPKQKKDGCYILEVNTHPGMTPLSILPEICAYYNITYQDIINRLIQDALKS
jgi:D-alanine-D-alanine ligase